jgi:crossover junction endodeoxyribonuclease RuvC
MENRRRVYHLTGLKSRRRDLRRKSTSEERLLWDRVRNNQLGVKFRRQFSVMGYVVDFYCPKSRLVVELLGGVHKNKEQQIYDEHRENYLKAFSIRILKFWNSDVENNLDKVIFEIKNNLTPTPLQNLGEGKLTR